MSTNSSSSASASFPVPNYIDPETRGPAGKIIGITLISIVSVLIVLRVYTRQFISKSFGLDDILILFSYVPATAYAIIGVYGETYLQWNRHVWDVEPRLFGPSLQASLAELILFDLSTNLTKLSMLATIHRVTSSSHNKTMNILVTAMSYFIGVSGLIFILVTIFQCSPVSAYWTPTLGPKKCIDEKTHLLISSIINTITDFVVVFLPMKLVMKLDLPRTQRIIVVGLFGAGFLACAAGIVKIYFTWVMTTAMDRDLTWNSWPVWISGGIELYVGIICASIPAIKPFFAIYLPQLIDTNMRSRKPISESKDLKSYPSTDFSNSNVSFQTFISGPSTPELPLLKPRPAQHKKSTSTSMMGTTKMVQPAITHKKSSSADLNKPLPLIQDTKQLPPPMPPLRSLSSSSTEEESVDEFSTQRNARRFTNTSTAPSTAAENRTTVLIMYKGDDEQGYGRAF